MGSLDTFHTLQHKSRRNAAAYIEDFLPVHIEIEDICYTRQQRIVLFSLTLILLLYNCTLYSIEKDTTYVQYSRSHSRSLAYQILFVGLRKHQIWA